MDNVLASLRLLLGEGAVTLALEVIEISKEKGLIKLEITYEQDQ